MQTKNRQHRPPEKNDAASALSVCVERFESFIELSSEGYWEQDENFRFTMITAGTLGSSGVDPKTYLGTARWDHAAVPVGDGGSWDKHKALLESRQPFTDFVMKRCDSTGATRYISASGQPVFDERGRFRGYRGTTRDITREKHEEMLLRMEHTVARCLTEADGVSNGVREAMRAVCETQGWKCGRYFVVDENAGLLRFADAWGVAEPEIERYIEASRTKSYTLGDGLHGTAWQTGQPQWVADMGKGARLAQATRASVRGALVFPVFSEGKTTGVISFTSDEVREPDARLLQAVRMIGSQIGQFLLRQRAEEELRRFRAAMDSSADMVVLVDRRTMRYVDVNDTVCRLLGHSREELLNMGPADLLLHWHDRRPVSREELERAHDELIANPGIHTGMRTFYKCKDGSLLPAELTRTALYSGGTHITVVIARDIRQQIAAEQALRESEDRFRHLSELSSDLFWEQDDQYRFTSFGGVGTTKLSETMIGKKRWEETYVNMSADDWTEHIATLDARKPFRDLELCRVDESGRKIWISISGEPVFDASGTFKGYHGVGKNITEVRRNEQLRALEHAVNRGLANAESVSSAIQEALRAICESESWECGRYWRVDEKAKLLRFGEAWGAPGDPAIARYIEASREVTYAPGTGINGRVWQTGEPVWASDRGKHAGLSESIFGSTRDIFMFPLIADGKTVGVFNFISRMLRAPDARLLQAVRVIGSQIAQFVQRKQAEEIVRESEERFRSLTQLSSDMYWEQDDQFRFTSFSGTGSQQVNVNTLKYIGRKRWEQNYVNMTADSWAEHISLLEAHKPFRDMELCRVDDKGRKIWISISGEPIFDASGVFKGYRGVGKDITERKLDEERIQFLANHDALTALPNRAMFTEVLNLAIQNARRYRRHFAVLFIDLDRFKVINDTLGHEAGDKLLQEMAKRLTRTVRSSDVVARLGGDEFVVLVHEVSEPKQVAAVARKILAALVQPLMMSQQEVRMTASIGICMYPNDAQDEQSLMKNADIAMYRAKEDGKNNYKYYSEEINVHSFEKLALETSLRRGLERDEFTLHYQAKLDLRTGVITGVEALVRWRHPDLGMVPPGQFIPLAEETGLIVPIGKWVLRTACAQVIDWQRRGLPPMRMAVNLSARQFADDNLVADIEAVLRETGIAPDLLELELTESMVIQNTERAGRVLAEIKRLGARLAIDDFGVGYSSLSHLKRFPIDTLKVDRSFIRDIPADAEDKAITEAIIAMGKSLSLTVVAEGVETREQQEFLREHACDEMQGFYFSKPIPPEEFAEFLRERVRKA